MSAAKIGIFPVAANERDEPLRGSSRDAVAKRQGLAETGAGPWKNGPAIWGLRADSSRRRDPGLAVFESGRF